MGSRSKLDSIAAVVAIVSVMLAAGACTGSTTSASGPASSVATGGGTGNSAAGAGNMSNPCSLLTQAEVSTIVGQAVGPGDNSTDSHECNFQYPANDVPKIQAGIGIESETSITSLCQSGAGFTVTAIAGVGDAACFVSVPGMSVGDNLTFAHAGHVFTVTASFGSSGTDEKILAADKALALAALGHMP